MKLVYSILIRVLQKILVPLLDYVIASLLVKIGRV